MGIIVWSIIILVLLVGAILVKPKLRHPKELTGTSANDYNSKIEYEKDVKKADRSLKSFKKIKKGVVAVLALLLLIPLAAGSFAQIDQREVGILTSFGKYENSFTTGGLHGKAPWQSVEKFEGTLQPVTLEGVSVTFSDGKLENASIAGGKGTISGSVDWQIGRDKVQTEALWEQYRTFEKVSNNLVYSASRDSVIAVANQYTASTATVSQKDIAAKVKESMEAKTKEFGIEIIRVSITAIDLDPNTQEAVDKLYSTQQDIKRAENEKVRAQVDAEKAKIQQASGSTDPDQLVKYCLDIVNSWDTAKSGALPATYNCGLDSSKSSVIVDTTKKE